MKGVMFTAQALKAYVAAFLAGITALTVAAESGGISLFEWLTAVGAVLVAFQATYWTTNAKAYNGSIDVVNTGEKKVFSLNLDSNPEDLETMKDVAFKINPS